MKCPECGSDSHSSCGLIDHAGGGATLPREPQVFRLNEIPDGLLEKLAIAAIDPDQDAQEKLLYQG